MSRTLRKENASEQASTDDAMGGKRTKTSGRKSSELIRREELEHIPTSLRGFVPSLRLTLVTLQQQDLDPVFRQNLHRPSPPTPCKLRWTGSHNFFLLISVLGDLLPPPPPQHPPWRLRALLVALRLFLGVARSLLHLAMGSAAPDNGCEGQEGGRGSGMR
eukprot:753290-Hanusia_phi.AAC.2